MIIEDRKDWRRSLGNWRRPLEGTCQVGGNIFQDIFWPNEIGFDAAPVDFYFIGYRINMFYSRHPSRSSPIRMRSFGPCPGYPEPGNHSVPWHAQLHVEKQYVMAQSPVLLGRPQIQNDLWLDFDYLSIYNQDMPFQTRSSQDIQ